ncbi:hypothetical protein BJX99DRAFT_258046 [Aspergillus californicus]
MGGYDTYCSICGAVLCQPLWRDEGDEDAEHEYEYDRSIIKVSDVIWMNDVRVISENPDSASINKVFISGLADYEDVGIFHVEPGNHPNFPTESQAQYNDGQVDFRCYDWDTEHPCAIPFHTACYRVLEECLSTDRCKEKLVDEEVLYQTWKCFVDLGGFSQCLLGISYGIVTNEQYWPTIRGKEASAMNPLEIPQLQTYYRNMALFKKSDTNSEIQRPISEIQLNKDPFARLAPELLLIIVSQLPIASLESLRAASPAIGGLGLSNGFWKHKLRHDMPWLFDLPGSGDKEPDWAKCYAELLERSDISSPIQIRGLVNRRRIWGVCEQFAPSYAEKKATLDENCTRSEASLLAGAISTPMRRLTSIPPRTESSALPLLQDLSDLQHSLPRLLIFWSRKGALSGFGTQAGGTLQTEDTVGSRDHFAVRDEVNIRHGDWIRGFIVTSCRSHKPYSERKVVGIQVLFIYGESVQLGQRSGDARLIHVENDHLLAGLLAQWSPADLVSGLSLLQVPASGHTAHTAHTAQLAEIQATKPEAHSEIGSRLWKDSLPPPEITLSQERFGYWTSDLKVDLAPMEALFFGTDENELSAIIEVSGDTQLGAFEVRYSNQPPKSIGPRPLTLKSLSIDGPGGERIISVTIVVSHIITGIRVVTNFNRQLVLGPCEPNVPSETIYSSNEEKALCGIYCTWTDRSSPKARLECLAGMFYPSPNNTIQSPPLGPQETIAHDRSHWWEPSSPPSTWTPSGPIHGAHEGSWNEGVQYPSSSASATWLDCITLPIHKIRLNYAHPTENLPFTPISLILEYIDGSINSVGPTRLNPPTDDEGDNGAPWCWCHMGGRGSRPERGKTLHYRSGEEWIIESGSMLDSCRFWVDGGVSGSGPLTGMQFVSAAGDESPCWGACEGPAAAVISFGKDTEKDEDGNINRNPHLPFTLRNPSPQPSLPTSSRPPTTPKMTSATLPAQPRLHRNGEHKNRCAARYDDGSQCGCTSYKYSYADSNGYAVCTCGHREMGHGAET